MRNLFWIHNGVPALKSWRDKLRQGTVSIEMALIAPIFFLMFIGIVEISLILLVQHMLENATFNASRLAKTGYIATGKTQMETVIDVLNTELGSLSPLIDVAKLTFTSTSYGSLTPIGQAGAGTDGLGTPDQVVVITVDYPWKIFTPLIGELIGDANYMMTISSRIVVRNEPYNST